MCTRACVYVRGYMRACVRECVRLACHTGRLMASFMPGPPGHPPPPPPPHLNPLPLPPPPPFQPAPPHPPPFPHPTPPPPPAPYPRAPHPPVRRVRRVVIHHKLCSALNGTGPCPVALLQTITKRYTDLLAQVCTRVGNDGCSEFT